ncbi:MAG: LLM class flavin-dependent oxidoreductase [Alphaproteobacteria bacterium]|nr:LLM class flavin-dependent oxidoreductase [Alphaproteobacteria bacterium]
MEFSIQLSADYPDKDYGGDRVYKDMLDQAVLADRLGFDAVSVTEHHLVNCLMMPAPLTFAVKIAAMTSRIKIMTSIVVLPLHDMRSYAGEVVVADILTEGRLLLGIGRGAFKYEMERFGVPMEETQDRFNESLDVLQALLTREEVSWDGTYYKFEPLTVMPRPTRPGGPPMMMAVMNPDGIYHCTRKGFHIQTTPLSGNHQLLLDQVSAFNRAKQDMNAAPGDVTLTLSRVAHIARDQADKERKIAAAHKYYGRFDNIFLGPGTVSGGMIEEIECRTPVDELGDSLLICTADEMRDKLAPYAELGIDRVILNVNFGLDPADTLETIASFAEEVMPHFTTRQPQAAE